MSVAGIPGTIPNLKLWLKADVGTFQDTALTTPAVTNADPVQGWADQSGNGFNFTQAVGGNAAAFSTNQQNSLPSVTFNGTNSYLTHANIPLANGVTIVAALRATTSTAGHNTCPVLLDNCAVTPATNFGFWAGVAFSSFFLQHQTNNQATNGPPVTEVIAPNSYLTTGWRVMGITSTPVFEYVIDNQDIGAIGGAYKDSTGVWSLGATNAGAQFMTLKLGELLVYDGNLTKKQLHALTTYLNGRWATYNVTFGPVGYSDGYYDPRQY